MDKIFACDGHIPRQGKEKADDGVTLRPNGVEGDGGLPAAGHGNVTLFGIQDERKNQAGGQRHYHLDFCKMAFEPPKAISQESETPAK